MNWRDRLNLALSVEAVIWQHIHSGFNAAYWQLRLADAGVTSADLREAVEILYVGDRPNYCKYANSTLKWLGVHCNIRPEFWTCDEYDYCLDAATAVPCGSHYSFAGGVSDSSNWRE